MGSSFQETSMWHLRLSYTSQNPGVRNIGRLWGSDLGGRNPQGCNLPRNTGSLMLDYIGFWVQETIMIWYVGPLTLGHGKIFFCDVWKLESHSKQFYLPFGVGPVFIVLNCHSKLVDVIRSMMSISCSIIDWSYHWNMIEVSFWNSGFMGRSCKTLIWLCIVCFVLLMKTELKSATIEKYTM